MSEFQAFRIASTEPDTGHIQKMKLEQLTAGDVVIQVHYSSLNYKDALAVTGKGKILRQFPLNPGIDAAGVVIESKNADIRAGQKVLVTGCGTGENFDGGYSEILRTQAASVVPLPQGLTLQEAMILGTAGFTAALARYRLELNKQTPDMGPLLVTGASGGVGSFAVQIFSQAGYEVHAVSGKAQMAEYLRKLGAQKVIKPEDLQLGTRPLESIRYGGAVDNVGGELLSRILAHVQLWGSVASIGLAESAELHTTVMPFILRGVSLLGISSNNCTRDVRHEIWRHLATDWKPRHLQDILTRTIGLSDLPSASHDLLNRKIHGRVLVQIQEET